MDTAEVIQYLDLLEDNLDGLEESIDELLPSESAAEASKKLPLLDRAKLHVTIVYAIESLLFSYLRLHNVSPHTHPVFKELTRVKSYFDKIKEIENAPPPGQKRDVGLDKQATGRMIMHALAGNNKIDLEAAERKAKEALLAKMKLRRLETKKSLGEDAVRTPVPSSDPVIPEPDVEKEQRNYRISLSTPALPLNTLQDPASTDDLLDVEEGELEDGEVEEGEVPKDPSESYPSAVVETPTKSHKKKNKKSSGKKKRQREAEMAAAAAAAENGTPKSKKKKRKHSSIGPT